MYTYTADLLSLAFCRPQQDHGWAPIMAVSTQLNPKAWETALKPHPDKAFSRFLVEGLRQGFRIGFNRQAPLKPASRNIQSAHDHPQAIDDYLAKERALGRMLGPFIPEVLVALPEFQVNRVRVIPKGHDTGRWRLITELSYPPNGSVNDGIEPDLMFSFVCLSRSSGRGSHPAGRGALLAKVDIESAYRLIPVHPQDRLLQAVQWRSNIYIDPMLPFGLRSAPKIFNAVADALEWYMCRQGVQHIFHYLDDFIVLGAPNTQQCAQSVAILDQTCAALGVPIAEHKRDGPTTCLTFLGIEMDTQAGSLRLPANKLSRLQALLAHWGDRKACARRELESLIGLLNHACKVVWSGRSFLRRMIDLLHTVPMHPMKPHPIRLNREFRSDLAWWRLFASEWNGVSFLTPPTQHPVKELATDASGSWGCGAWHGNHWFQLAWDEASLQLPITVKELLPIILACERWGIGWSDQCIRCHCDNQAVVANLRSRTSRDRHCLYMLRVLAFIEARYNFHIQPLYISTKLNYLADDLSRNHLPSFLLKVPDADGTPDSPSPSLLGLLLNPNEAWISQRCRRQFGDIFGRV